MSIDIADIFRTLIPSSFRGVSFWMPDSRVTAGRRVQKFLFPGRDDSVWEDLGALDGPMQISGLLVGDDYVSQAQDMLEAFRAPGAGLLMHPWLGELNVIMPQPGTISFSQTHLRLAKIEFAVELYDPTQPAPTNTLTMVLDAIQDAQDAVNGLVNAVLTPIRLTVAAIGIVQSVCGQVVGVFSQVVGSAGFIASAVQGALGGLASVGGLSLGIAYPAAVAAVLAAPAAAIAATSATLAPAAVGPGDAPLPAVPQDPRVTTAILLAASGQIVAIGNAAPASAAAPAAPIALAAAAVTLASGIDASTDIVYTSQQDAQGQLVLTLAAIDLVAGLALSLCPALPAAAGPVWRAMQSLRACVVADVNAQLGRLPIVTQFTLAGTMPAWLVAQALVGDTPGQVVAMYQDLVARNAVSYPLAMGPGAIEALVA